MSRECVVDAPRGPELRRKKKIKSPIRIATGILSQQVAERRYIIPEQSCVVLRKFVRSERAL